MCKTSFAKKRLEKFEKIKNFLELNSVFNLMDLAKILGRGKETTRHDIRAVCCREGFKIKPLGKSKSGNKNDFQVIKLGYLKA